MPEVESIWFRILYADSETGAALKRCYGIEFDQKPVIETAWNLRDRIKEPIMGEIFTSAFLAFTLILVGMGLGFLMLKLQGGEE